MPESGIVRESIAGMIMVAELVANRKFSKHAQLEASSYRWVITKNCAVSSVNSSCINRWDSVYSTAHAPVAQLDRALPSGGRGHRFESCRAYQ